MKVPLVYPKMPDSKGCMLKRCYAYEKLDGTNIHWCWNKKDKFYAFGTRRDRFPLTLAGEEDFKKAHPGLEGVVDSFFHCEVHRRLAAPLDEFLSGVYRGPPRFSHIPKGIYSESEVVIFTEFFGEKSFAGQHEKDDHKDHYLIDVQVDGRLIPQIKWNMISKISVGVCPDLSIRESSPGILWRECARVTTK